MFTYLEEKLLVSFFIIGGILQAASQSISVADESCKIKCSCCTNLTCKSGSNSCDYGCKTGYHGGRCINLCPNKCITCIDKPNLDQVAQCLTCKDGYYSTADLYQCQTQCSDDCRICESKTNCTLCKDSYYLSDKQPGSCYSCPDGCATCVSEYECKSCNQKYFLSSSSEGVRLCKPCQITCALCTSFKECKKCEPGYYGVMCNRNCSEGCKNNQCSQDDGHCDCKDGFAGRKCDTCVAGMYGPQCNHNCSENCLNDTCKRQSGECFFCDEPFVGTFCKNCKEGNYGLYCNLSCSFSCLQSICNQSTGFCDSCKENHEGDFCENCKAGKYGIYCIFDCPINCLDGHCDRKNGTCFNCSQNTDGLKCDSCVDAFYGPNCLQRCSSRCRNSTCDRETGMCTNGCEDGFSGDKCCLNNSYCENCSSNETCSECILGTFGERCEDNCTDICVDQRCNKETGICLKDTASPNVNVAAIVVSVVVTVVVIIVVAVLVLFRKRLIYPFLTKNTKSTTDKLVMFSRLIADDRNGKQTKEDENRKSKPISHVVNGVKHRVKVNQLASYVSIKTKESYTKEFKELPDGLIKPCTDARKPENIAKNRYQSIYPYDEHRVKLTGPGSDFINACYIDGFRRKKEYIASLGPIMKATENFFLFWRMLWQEKVEKIVMVTNLIENGTMKCEQYWPTIGNTDCYGDVSVTCHSEDVYSDYTRRTFTVAKGKEQRSLTHLHFTAWPDKGVPDDVTSLIEFRQKVIATKVTLGGPTIVHCSAGVGRTGTFIALDRLTKEGEKERAVDVFQCVYNMRQQRTKMVQTEVLVHCSLKINTL